MTDCKYKSFEIGKVVENLRRMNRLTQEELAEKAGLDRNTISNIERDIGVPSYASILDIGFALNLTPKEFGAEVEKHSKILDYYKQNKEN